MLSLLFIRGALSRMLEASRNSGDYFNTGVLLTPFGVFAGVLQSQLELFEFEFVNERGEVGRKPMKKLYLDYIFSRLSGNLKVEYADLLDGSREFIIIDECENNLLEECCPRYYATTKDPDDMESIKRLESTVVFCLDRGMSILPSSVLNEWKKEVLTPLFGHVKSKLTD
jgi:hypothetical protein